MTMIANKVDGRHMCRRCTRLRARSRQAWLWRFCFVVVVLLWLFWCGCSGVVVVFCVLEAIDVGPQHPERDIGGAWTCGGIITRDVCYINEVVIGIILLFVPLLSTLL